MEVAFRRQAIRAGVLAASSSSLGPAAFVLNGLEDHLQQVLKRSRLAGAPWSLIPPRMARSIKGGKHPGQLVADVSPNGGE